MLTDAGSILDVSAVAKDGCGYAVRCPHCKEVLYVEGNNLREIRGEQYNHKEHWLAVTSNARLVEGV